MRKVLVFVAVLFLSVGTYAKADASKAMPAVVSYLLSGESGSTSAQNAFPSNSKIIFLHHSTGGKIWGGDGQSIKQRMDQYNANNNKTYQISKRYYPTGDEYPQWSNSPYIFYRIWVNGETELGGSTLTHTFDYLTSNFDVVVWKHCFTESNIYGTGKTADLKNPSVDNFKEIYKQLRQKMLSQPNTRFIVWTLALFTKEKMLEMANNNEQTAEQRIKRAREFAKWVREEWDKPGDNIYVWDFWTIEAGGPGGLFLQEGFAHSPTDSHPNKNLSSKAAPLFLQRIVDVIEGRGDTGSITGGAIPSP